MNPIYTLRLLTTSLSVTALATAGCADKAKPAEAKLTVVKQTGAVANSTFVAPVSWADLNHKPYAMRDAFIAGLKGLEATVDQQVAELKARRAAKPASTDLAKWDLAMKDMESARVYLKSSHAEAAQATEQTWNQRKDQVGLAWVHTQDAYAKVLASTTN